MSRITSQNFDTILDVIDEEIPRGILNTRHGLDRDGRNVREGRSNRAVRSEVNEMIDRSDSVSRNEALFSHEEPDEKKNVLLIHNGWNDNNEVILVNLGEQAAGLKWMHEQSTSLYAGIHQVMGVLVIILGATLSIETSIPNQAEDYGVNVYKKVAIYIITLISAVQNFLKYEQRAARHKEYSNAFSEIYRKVQHKMSMYRKDRGSAQEYVSNITKEFDAKNLDAPGLNMWVVGRFKTKFKTNGLSAPSVADNIDNIHIVAEEELKKSSVTNLRIINQTMDVCDSQVENMPKSAVEKMNKRYIEDLVLGKDPSMYEMSRLIEMSRPSPRPQAFSDVL